MARTKRVIKYPAVAGRWVNVAAPAGWTWSLPFTIQRRGRVFRPHPSFSLQAYALAQIAAGTTYYVSTSGNDGNTGLSWAQALRSPGVAHQKADARIIYIDAGYYYRNETYAGVTPVRSMAIIGVGDVYLTADCRNQVGAFSAVGNHYEAACTRTVKDVYDETSLTAYGGHSRLALQANSGAVDTTVGSWYWAANVLYVRTTDSRAPDASMHYYEQSTPLPMYAPGADRILYCENLKLWGGASPSIGYTAATFDIRLYFNNCDLRYASNVIGSTYNAFSVWGITEAIFFNVKLAHSVLYDGFNYKLSGGVTPRAIEYNCESWDHGDGSIDQPSTTHDGTTIVRINGRYHDCAGASVIADTGSGGKTWCLGTLAYSPKTPATTGGFYVDTGQSMWLDRCATRNLGASAKGVNVADATSAIRHRKLITDGTLVNNGGTLEAY